jgi:L-fucose mutarotase
VREPVREDGLAVIRDNLPEGGGSGSIERQEFYARAARAFAVVRCTEQRAYGCFILRKGFIF